MEKDYFKYYKPNFLIGFIIAAFVIVYLAKEYFVLSISIFGVITLLIGLITKYFWKSPIFKWLFWVDDFSGRYEGKLIYQYVDELGKLQTGERDHIKIINQTGSKITVSSFTKKSDGSKSSLSHNKGMFVEKTQDEKHYNLIYSYLNDGSKEQGFSPHYGTEVIKFIRRGSEKSLSGSYYTDRIPHQTKGVYKDLKWVSKNDEHEF
ncbi:MAG: hypothetical protein HRT69_13095 [Flavobacteriaceae bacterium]|nr:hypothetical protein [Flavobacteriaceae bacterium]